MKARIARSAFVKAAKDVIAQNGGPGRAVEAFMKPMRAKFPDHKPATIATIVQQARREMQGIASKPKRSGKKAKSRLAAVESAFALLEACGDDEKKAQQLLAGAAMMRQV